MEPEHVAARLMAAVLRMRSRLKPFMVIGGMMRMNVRYCV